jgi:glutathione peroxidase
LYAAVLFAASTPVGADCPPALDATRRLLASDEQVNLCQAYLGKVVLIVNTASKCGYTPQYEGLEQLHERYRDRGLVVLGFPSNDFGGQEPGTEKQIQQFCRLTYSVRFPMLEKTHVIGESADPIYKALQAQTGRAPQWNFHKYLLDRRGMAVASFPSGVQPDDPALVQAVEELLESDPAS